MRRLLALCLPVPLIPLVFTSSPLQIEWNTTRSYGPDGPWPVVTIEIGNATQDNRVDTVDLHPGGIGRHLIFSKQSCNGQSQCRAAAAGLYNINPLQSAMCGPTISSELYPDSGQIEYGRWNFCNDSVAMRSNGVLLITEVMCHITVMDEWTIRLPSGTNYSSQVGTFSLYPWDPLISTSFGLHYGSVPLGLVGSLVFGGYDQSRVLGDAAVIDVSQDEMMIVPLLDIEIGVETGGTPFNSSVPYPGSASETNASYITGLLQQNASFHDGQPTIIDPQVNYMFLSPETCSNIAQNLPVTLQPNIGLYTWDADKSTVAPIVHSPAYLAFVFAHSGTGNITIKVPFALLNLTIEPPIVATPQQYFPCRPLQAENEFGYLSLGKAFIQAAFIGRNWDANKWFMAQAPGPGIGPSNLRLIDRDDNAIMTSDPIGNFETSWAQYWTPISHSGISPEKTPPNSSSTFSGADSSSSGLSNGAKVGIGLSTCSVGFALFGIALYVGIRIRKRRHIGPAERHGRLTLRQEPRMVQEKDATTFIPEIGTGLLPEMNALGVQEKDAGPAASEVGTGMAHELDAQDQIRPTRCSK